jgi:hypothetical protein
MGKSGEILSLSGVREFLILLMVSFHVEGVGGAVERYI